MTLLSSSVSALRTAWYYTGPYRCQDFSNSANIIAYLVEGTTLMPMPTIASGGRLRLRGLAPVVDPEIP